MNFISRKILSLTENIFSSAGVSASASESKNTHKYTWLYSTTWRIGIFCQNLAPLLWSKVDIMSLGINSDNLIPMNIPWHQILTTFIATLRHNFVRFWGLYFFVLAVIWPGIWQYIQRKKSWICKFYFIAYYIYFPLNHFFNSREFLHHE